MLCAFFQIRCWAAIKSNLWRYVPPALQWAPITRDASGDVGCSFWGWHFPFSFPRANPRCYGTLNLGWYLSHMRSLSFVCISLPFVIISEGKFEFIRHSFIHFVLHHWHTVVFWRTPGKEKKKQKNHYKKKTSTFCPQMQEQGSIKTGLRTWANPIHLRCKENFCIDFNTVDWFRK